MAINSRAENGVDVHSAKSSGSSNHSKNAFGLKVSICSSTHWRNKNSSDSLSPYLNGDNVSEIATQPMIENKMTSKKGTAFASSFPLAVNIYKANSDEFKNVKASNRKAKKSVLTLPNEPAPMPQTCTVSDMNDSEYFNQDDRKHIKKRNPAPRKRKPKYESYDKNARFCSQMMDLDRSSSDIITEEKRLRKSKLTRAPRKQGDGKPNPHDVWAILRNINQFQFKPSPPMSEESYRSTATKRKGRKRRQKNMRVVETEEFAYITSSYDIECKSQRSISKSSSFDRITVIDKEHEFNQICKVFERKFTKSNNLNKSSNKPQIRSQNNKAITYNKSTPKAYLKNITPKLTNQKLLALEYNQKKPCINNCGDIKENKGQYNASSSNTLSNDEFDYNGDQYSNEEEEVKPEFIHSDNSGSSKAAATRGANSKYANKTGMHSPNGITKVNLIKGVVPGKYRGISKEELIKGDPKRKRLNQVDMPKSLPRLTQTDIKRRIARMKFPIVVLGKDQLSSNYEVVNIEPIHFNSLKTHMWPFMRQWQIKQSANANSVTTLKTSTDSSMQKKKCYQAPVELNKPKKTNRGMVTQKLEEITNKGTDEVIINNTKNKLISEEHKRTTPQHEVKTSKKPTPVHVFKERMLKLFNLPAQSFANETNDKSKQKDFKVLHARKFCYSRDVSPSVTGWVKSREVPRNPINSPVRNTKQALTTKKPWAKASWASEIIDNVIKKIRNGVYYTHDPSKQINRKRQIELKEVEIQTISTGNDESIQSISKVTIKKKSTSRLDERLHLDIPGFDDSKLPALEIQSLTPNQISVKHCVTNILVHFDITIPSEPTINANKSISLTQHDLGSRTKTFKCKTSIINSMLPAEICTLLPRMMSNLTAAESHFGLLRPRTPLEKQPTLLSTISEIHTDSPETQKPLPFLEHLRMAVQLQALLDGFYSIKTTTKAVFKKQKTKFDRYLACEMLPILSRRHLFNIDVDLNSPMIDHFHKIMRAKLATNAFCKNPINTCTTIMTYAISNSLLPSFKRFDLNSFLQNINSYPMNNLLPRVLNCLINNHVTINLTSINSQGLEDITTINIRSLMNNIRNKYVTKSADNAGSINSLPAIQYIKMKEPASKKDISPPTSNKTKRRRYHKLHRKCRSSSNIPQKTSTSLKKITNIDEFFEALGSDKQFSGAFDKMYCHKIMTSLKEMSNWITEINPTQALLVLLLTNKTDTPDLTRFRPVILQGIAFNRITRVKELDMEIEVIKREHMNVERQYEGISYLPSSAENKDNLLKELCWIAKTTASDYQRIFDESSKKLLKSLLEKRKKLNPSYLRVMARYVGLGLLKTPPKHELRTLYK